ncbi:MAG: hypothetical protein IPG70_16510 [Moraxellaceae bacterium]|nr:hypothetical protein [Moraxellaceae bacterium]
MYKSRRAIGREQNHDPTRYTSVWFDIKKKRSKERIKLNEMATRFQGYPKDKFADRDVANFHLRFGAKSVVPKSVQLAITVCLEHYTKDYCRNVITRPDVQQICHSHVNMVVCPRRSRT